MLEFIGAKVPKKIIDYGFSLPLQTRREKIGQETGSSKFQLLEKD